MWYRSYAMCTLAVMKQLNQLFKERPSLLFLQLLQLLHFYFLSAVHSYDLYHIHFNLLSLQLLQLLHNCESTYSLSAVHITYDLYHIHISLFSFLRNKLHSLLTCFQRGFIAQLVEHRIGIAEVMGSTPVEASDKKKIELSLQLLKLLHNWEDHFHLYSLSAVHIYDLYHNYIIYH